MKRSDVRMRRFAEWADVCRRRRSRLAHDPLHQARPGGNAARSLQEADVLNVTVSIDRPTFIRFLNPNRTFFLNTQIFLRYIAGHDPSFDVNGRPSAALGTFTVATGYYQERLLPAATSVHDVRSGSGPLVGQIGYGFSEAFSTTVGLLAFYGQPDDNQLPMHPIALPDTQPDFDARTRYESLSAISEREELFLELRYTF
jgi:hypothetical protein